MCIYIYIYIYSTSPQLSLISIYAYAPTLTPLRAYTHTPTRLHTHALMRLHSHAYTHLSQITRLAEYTTWFNTPLESSRVLADRGLVEDTFATTVKMSTYLVAWLIGDDMVSIKDVNKHGVNVSEGVGPRRGGACGRGRG